MSEKIEFALRTILIGVGATMVMDIWAILLRQFGIPSLNFALLGRWIGHLPRGHWMHESMANATPVRGVFNCIKSLVTHTVYGFGLYLAALATASL